MKTKAIALFLLGFIPAFAQDIPTSKTEQNMNRIERCKKNYTELFGGEALTRNSSSGRYSAQEILIKRPGSLSLAPY